MARLTGFWLTVVAVLMTVISVSLGARVYGWEIITWALVALTWCTGMTFGRGRG